MRHDAMTILSAAFASGSLGLLVASVVHHLANPIDLFDRPRHSRRAALVRALQILITGRM